MIHVLVLQDGFHVPSTGGAGEGLPGGTLSWRVRAGDARHEDGAAWGQNTGDVINIPSLLICHKLKKIPAHRNIIFFYSELKEILKFWSFKNTWFLKRKDFVTDFCWCFLDLNPYKQLGQNWIFIQFFFSKILEILFANLLKYLFLSGHFIYF